MFSLSSSPHCKIRKGNNQRVWVLGAHPENDQRRQALEQPSPQARLQLGRARCWGLYRIVTGLK